MALNPGMPRADSVLSGGALTQLTRTPRGPSSCARYLVELSRDALAAPMMPYPGTARDAPMYVRLVMEAEGKVDDGPPASG